MRMANHFRPGTPLFIRFLSSRSLRAITAYVLFARFTFKQFSTIFDRDDLYLAIIGGGARSRIYRISRGGVGIKGGTGNWKLEMRK